MLLSVTEEDKLEMENISSYYGEFKEVFGKDIQSELAEHGPQDITINLQPDTELPHANLYIRKNAFLDSGRIFWIFWIQSNLSTKST